MAACFLVASSNRLVHVPKGMNEFLPLEDSQEMF